MAGADQTTEVTTPGAGGGGGQASGSAGQGAAAKGDSSGKAESLKLIGGLIALASGLVVLGLIAAGALVSDSDNAVKVATGAFGVIGTLVGAYFGQKVGSDGTKEAAARASEEATKAQIYAAHLPPEEASKIVAIAHAAATGKPLPAKGDDGQGASGTVQAS